MFPYFSLEDYYALAFLVDFFFGAPNLEMVGYCPLLEYRYIYSFVCLLVLDKDYVQGGVFASVPQECILTIVFRQ